ncbi:YdcH family protein [Sedimenticola thiotaurini]|uniref:DUF465 domain-containing protein n=1 Tax=Sedimenticola thiotaurini TaxID=1543721 RepID=A0A0F7JX53_9GAMM|nr:DUF465 domain-containing protein [Sedimenticola thiotaurini]AKH19370.1 hypothetical protein AAY24_02300 [Sedimenticola thiotaurini]
MISIDAQHEELRNRLFQVRQEHRDLDVAIAALTETAYRNELQLKRLKRRKLMLKDAITKLEDELIPDLDA